MKRRLGVFRTQTYIFYRYKIIYIWKKSKSTSNQLKKGPEDPPTIKELRFFILSYYYILIILLFLLKYS